MNILKTVTLLLFIISSVQIVNAQYGGFNNYSSAAALSVRQHIQRSELRNSINRRRLMNRRNRSSGKRRAKKIVVPKVATGVSSFTMKKAILPDQFLKKARGSGAEKKANAAMLRSFLSKYKSIAIKDGFPANDLAYAFNYFLIHNYVAYHDLFNYYYKDPKRLRVLPNGVKETQIELLERNSFDLNTIPVERKIYDQYRAFLNTSPKIKKMTNDQKQLFAELLATISVMTFNIYGEAYSKNDGSKYLFARNAAKNNLENFFGVSVEKIKITEDGVSISK